MIAGDLRTIENKKLRKFLINDPNYRESGSINLREAFKQAFDQAFKACIENTSTKNKLETSTPEPWKNLFSLWKR